MAARIVWSELALESLGQLAAFIAKDSPHFAALTVSRILNCIEQAAAFPLSGRVVPEYAEPQLRELFWRNYRVIYRVETEQIIVLAMYRGHRLLPENFDKKSR